MNNKNNGNNSGALVGIPVSPYFSGKDSNRPVAKVAMF